ncbi:unnamed protein product (macronuclear) [Paramecium tetraurelia]|uniref:EF-hand domain-containing protein n=1 Tax=Paramecium tetraurelia TaxID=5888 RepID=A0E0N7_PARTE|nr:uncharacterized protein GSPATT00022022001 [Paramecium tetraurelia]CAK88854.1 unnamed protein product [Paramecium tetraurelia]|eukprot:XP_001456251.1 hypothetical protein (macronuclear) [Paramecium tetraurelia strain d4-2]
MNFCEFIQITVEGEDKLEEIRIALARLEMFELNTVYNRLDQPRQNAMKEEQILEFLDDNNLQVTQEESNYIFRVLDVDRDNLITLADFQSVILPKTNDQVKDQALNHKSYEMPQSMLLPKEVEATLTAFFEQLKTNYNQYANIQEPINLNELAIFESENLITLDSLKNWLQSIGQEIEDQILEKFLIIIDGDPNNLQNLIEQIFYQIEQQEDQQNEAPQQNQEQEQPKQNQIEVQDINYSQPDLQKSDALQESFNPNQTQKQHQNQEQSEQKKDEQQDQIAQSKFLQESQPYYSESPLLNYYHLQIRDEEDKIKKLCDELNITNTYTQKREESALIKYYEKEIAREQEIYNRLLQESRQTGAPSKISKSTFTPDPLYLDDYQREINRIDNEIRKETTNISFLSSKFDNSIGLSTSYLKQQQNLHLRYESPRKHQESYLYDNFSGQKKQFGYQ